MTLLEQIEQDVNNALKAGEAGKVSTLRLLKTALKNQQISQKGELSDQDSIKVIQKEAKQRRDSIESFAGAGRSDLADKEKVELEILEAYLPAQMSEADIQSLVNQAVEESAASTMADMGRVMQILGPKIAGQADGSLVANIVRKKLEG